MARMSTRLRSIAGGAAGGGGSLLSKTLDRLDLTVTGGSIVVLAVIVWFVAHALGSKTVYLMVYASVVLLVMAWVVARRLPAVDIERSRLPMRLRVSQSVDVELVIRARRRVSTILIQEELPEALGRTLSIPIASLAPGHAISHVYSFRPSVRGVYNVGPTTATWSDPFGFTTHHRELRRPTELIVHPSTEMVHDRILTRMWEDPPLRPPASKPWPTGFEFYGMRDYVPGDDLRRVVWNAVAKTGRMLVRESEQGITDRILVILDTDAQWHSPGVPSASFETAVRTAASVGVKHLADGFSVSLVTNTARPLSALRGARARLAFLDELARVQLSKASLAEAGKHLLREARGGAHVVVITPHVDREMASRLRLMIERGASIVAAIVQWEETDPLSTQRAAAIGCRVIQVPLTGALEAVFALRGRR